MDLPPPKIEFPCDFPIKIMGTAGDDFTELVLAVVSEHAPDFYRESVKVRPSSSGKYTSVTVTLRCTGPEQLESIHIALKATGRVAMVI